MTTTSRRLVLMAALVPLVGGVAGCTGDEPRMVNVPVVEIKPDTAPPPIPNRKVQYGASKKYQDSMNNVVSP